MNKQLLNKLSPYITFFGLSTKQQMEVLPILRKEIKYDFPDGDLITSSTLEVLLNGYKTHLNSIAIALDEASSDRKSLAHIIERLLEIISNILKENFENSSRVIYLESPEWDNLCHLSQTMKRQLQIQTEVNTDILIGCINYWLHS